MLKCASFSEGDTYSLIKISDCCKCEFQNQAVTLCLPNIDKIIFVNSISDFHGPSFCNINFSVFIFLFLFNNSHNNFT